MKVENLNYTASKDQSLEPRSLNEMRRRHTYENGGSDLVTITTKYARTESTFHFITLTQGGSDNFHLRVEINFVNAL
jgi:hypothetical protein